MKTALVIVAIVALFSIELWAAYAVLHPHVSPAYRAYFIDRTTNDWVPQRYAATPESGILFGKASWPEFVAYTSGFSSQEDWGRWTDSTLTDTPKIVITRQFSGPLCIEMVAHPSAAERGKRLTIAFGKSSQDIVLSNPDSATYDISFDNAPPSNAIEFRFAEKPPPNNQLFPNSQDPRELGLAQRGDA